MPITAAEATWRKLVADTVYTTDHAWGPSTKDFSNAKPSTLPPAIAKLYAKETKHGEDVDVFTRKIGGKPVYLFSEQGDGATLYSLRDVRGHALKMGNKAHVKTPLPHSLTPGPVSDSRYLKDLKDAMRYPVQLHDTPIVTGAAIPPKIQAIVAKMLAEKESDGFLRFDKVYVHKVRVDGRDSYLVVGDTFDAVSEEMFAPNGTKLNVHE